MKCSSCNLLLTILLAGCGVGSFSQAFPDSARKFDPQLIGEWRSADKETFVVTVDNAQGYMILFKDENGNSGVFTARMGTIGKFRVLDVQPDKSLLTMNDSYKDLLLPMHSVLFFDSIGGELRFRMILPDSLGAVLERDPAAIAHVRSPDFLLLTATPSELQHFLAGLVEKPGMLGDPTVLTKHLANR